MRRRVIVFACLAADAAGCGGDGEQRVQRSSAPVALAVTSPSDNAVVRTETVQIRGTVRPAGAESVFADAAAAARAILENATIADVVERENRQAGAHMYYI